MMNSTALNEVWRHLHTSSPRSLFVLGENCGVRLWPGEAFRSDDPVCILCLHPIEGVIKLSEMTLNFNRDASILYSAETMNSDYRRDLVLAQFQADSQTPAAAETALLILKQILDETRYSIEIVGRELQKNSVHPKDAADPTLYGIEDLQALDGNLSTLTEPLALLSRSLFDLEEAVRWLRTLELVGRERLEHLLEEIECEASRVQFLTERKRACWMTADNFVSANSLSVNKIFNALWSIVIPSGVLVNWYGENFRFMPELAFSGTMPIQLVSVLLITLLPLLILQISGVMR